MKSRATHQWFPTCGIGYPSDGIGYSSDGIGYPSDGIEGIHKNQVEELS